MSITRTIRLSPGAERVLERNKVKGDMTTNRFINECIEACNVPVSRLKKQAHTKRIRTLTNLMLIQNSTLYTDLPPVLLQGIIKTAEEVEG